MRVATFVLGIALVMTEGTSGASDSTDGPSNSIYSATTFARGVLAAPTATDRLITANTNASPYAQERNLRNGAFGAMGFVPAQNPASFRSRPTFGDHTAQQAAQQRAQQDRPYHPRNIPLPATRTLEDHLLTGFVALMLIAYQLRRKHRFLRPHQFSA